MSNYIPNYDKKRKTLARREHHLRHLIKHAVTNDKLIAAAEHVRQSRIGLLKSLQANPPIEHRRHPEQWREIAAKIQALLEMPVEAILGEFGVSVPQDKIAE